MNRGFGMITAFLVLAAALCVEGTVMSREQHDQARENERYALLEDAFRERARTILEEYGYHDSGVTLTWTREDGGVRRYLVEIHHSRIDGLGREDRERLSENLCWEDFCGEVESLSIVFI